MNAPLIWIGLPLIAAVALWFIRRRITWTALSAAGLLLLLGLIAWLVPFGSAMKMGPWTVEFTTTLTIFGRQFILLPADQPWLALLCLFGSFWFFGGLVVRPHHHFTPLGLGILALLVAALSVEPFLYAALLIETAVLLSIPLLVPTGSSPGQGVLRFLIFQTMAVPFILLAGWAAAAVEGNPSDSVLLSRAVIILGLGFAFWLAVFPFYSWVPQLVGEANPFTAGFLLTLLPTVVLLLALDFLNAFSWLRDFALLNQALRVMGSLMAVTGGIWAAFQPRPGRLFGYAVIVENGLALTALSLGTPAGPEFMVMLLLPRMAALSVGSLALALLVKNEDELTGLLRRKPLTAVGLLAAGFSLAGLPLLAGFPARLVLMQALSGQGLGGVAWVIFGWLGLIAGMARLFIQVASPSTTPARLPTVETWLERVFLAGGVMLIIIIGLFPGWLLSAMTRILQGFDQLR